MTGRSKVQSAPYRLIITRRQATELLVGSACGPRLLPSLNVASRARLARELTAGLGHVFNLQAVCLSAASDGAFGAHGVFEVLCDDAEAPAGTTWIATTDVDSLRSVAWADRSLIESSLESLHRKIGPFQRLGWIDELFDWTERQLEPFGLHLTGGFEQWNASPTFTLVRIETTGRALWFKATGDPNRQELALSLALTRLFPRYVPHVLAVHPSWNGWLSWEVPGTALCQTIEFDRWRDAAADLARLQISSIGKTNALVARGAKNLETSYLYAQIDPFVSRMHALMAAEQKATPWPMTEAELDALARDLKLSCEFLQDSDLPDTLGHLDLNPGNILVADGQSVFLDWAEASVAHPLLSFEYLREHMVHAGLRTPDAIQGLTRDYLAPWSRFVPAAELACALKRTPLVAVFAYAVANDCWRSPELFENSRLRELFRSLTGRMHQESVRLLERSGHPDHASRPIRAIEPGTDTYPRLGRPPLKDRNSFLP